MNAICSNCKSVIINSGDKVGCPICGYRGPPSDTGGPKKLSQYEITYFDESGNPIMSKGKFKK